MTSFRVLGSLDIIHADRSHAPRDPVLRQVLGMFLLHAGELVDADLLARELRDPEADVGTQVDRLRPLLTLGGAADPLVSTKSGYLLDVDPDLIDLGVFRRLVRSGREHLEEGRPGDAANALRHALGIWTGPVLAGVPSGPVLSALMAPLGKERRRALGLRVRADMLLGRHRELIEELRVLVEADPYDEWLAEQLVTSLIAVGKCSEALQLHLNLRLLRDREQASSKAFAVGD